MSKKQKNFFSDSEEKQIIQSIINAEKKTSGEIRVHIEEKLNKDPHERALEVFHELQMDQTKHHNGVLFYLATRNKQFVIYGDQGIHKKVTGNFWTTIKDAVISEFKKENYTQGIIDGIQEVGEQLKQ
ncbi:MAG: TPM domain-containing protein [Flavobacteriaceae bacterium]|nr:TPM domain-containing protein [Flavobacteriaceae bacterium]